MKEEMQKINPQAKNQNEQSKVAINQLALYHGGDDN